MFLKSLVIRGFKSFADKTTLVLEPGITIVVGPNGSGKSNVVDAISWVLGEQGPTALRGGSMQDVIYAGTAGRQALGMAEVTLTIDNSAGLLPIEFSEVTLSRTLFRSGESEYRLNGTTCRLLDIQEVLSDTGVGREQHTIIGQGQLDKVLGADSVQMRGFIEEAAGVGKHRRRKERAIRKLSATDQNLERLSDLASEVRRQLRPLREQAEIAKKHAIIEKEFTDIKLILAARDLKRVRDFLGPEGGRGSEQVLAAMEDQLAGVEEKLNELERLRAEASRKTDLSRETAWAFGRSIERLGALGRLAVERTRALEAELANTTEVAAQAHVREIQRQLSETEQMKTEASRAEVGAATAAAKAADVLATAVHSLRGAEEALASRAAQNEQIFEMVSAELVAFRAIVGGIREQVIDSLAALDGPDGTLTARVPLELLAASLEEFDSKVKDLQPTIEAGKAEVEGLRHANERALNVHRAATAAHDETRMAAGIAAERSRLLAERLDALHVALETAKSSASSVSGRRDELLNAIAVASRVGVTAESLALDAGKWAGQADEQHRSFRTETLRLEEAVVEARNERNGLSLRLDSLRSKAREEDLSRSEARIKARILEEKIKQELRADPEGAVARFGVRLEIEDGVSPGDAADRLASFDDESLQKKAGRLENQLDAMGRVNPLAEAEFEALTERESFLAGQMTDLRSSRRDLFKVVASVDEKVQELFGSAFRDVASEYEKLFALLFPGGKGRLKLTEPNDLLESGVEVEARPGGKNLKRLSLLSGGERALSALAVLFAIFKARPSPFYILDEVEAALDDVNLHRFLTLLAEFRNSSQLLVVTHQKRTMEVADVLYGISAGADGTSKVISERLSDSSPMIGDSESIGVS